MMDETGGLLQIGPRQVKEAVNSALQRGLPPRMEPLTAEALTEPGDQQSREELRLARERAEIARLNTATDEDVASEVESDIAMEKLEAQLRNSKRKYDEAMKHAALVEQACAMLRDIVVTLPPVEWTPPAPAVHVVREVVPTLVLCDAHLGDRYTAELMGGIGHYDYNVFEQKLERLYTGIKGTLDHLREYGRARRLKILILGDLATGVNIYPGQAHHLEFGAMEQSVRGADRFAHLLRELLYLPGVEEEDAECVPGNHGRPGKKGQDPYEDSWDNVLYEHMRLRLADVHQIRFQWHRSWWMLPDILGWQFLCEHGEDVKRFQQIPNYGLRRREMQWKLMLERMGKRLDYYIVGHHHVELEEETRMIGGAWPGASFFGAKALGSIGAESQLMFGVVEDYGVSYRYRIPLYEPRKPGTLLPADEPLADQVEEG